MSIFNSKRLKNISLQQKIKMFSTSEENSQNGLELDRDRLDGLLGRKKSFPGIIGKHDDKNKIEADNSEENSKEKASSTKKCFLIAA